MTVTRLRRARSGFVKFVEKSSPSKRFMDRAVARIAASMFRN